MKLIVSLLTATIIILVVAFICILFFGMPYIYTNCILRDVSVKPTKTKTLLMTTPDKNKVPRSVLQMFEKHTSGWRVIIMDDSEARKFLREHFAEDVSRKFNDLLAAGKGAHAADLLRFCQLYIYGGLYLDIKTVITSPIDWFDVRDEIFAVKGIYSKSQGAHIGVVGGRAGHAAFELMIRRMMATPHWLSSLNYHTHCLQFYYRVAPHFDVIWGEERHNDALRPDRHGVQASIYLGDRVIAHSRDPDYPWN